MGYILDSIEKNIRSLNNDRIVQEISNGPNDFEEGIFEIYLKVAEERGIDIYYNERLGTYQIKLDEEVAVVAFDLKSGESFGGRLNFRLIIPSILFMLFSVIGSLLGVFIFIPFFLLSLYLIYKSLPVSIFINSESLYIINPFKRKSKILDRTDIIETELKVVDYWKGSFNVFVNFFLFGWVSLLVFRGTHYTLRIVFGEYQDFRINSNKIKNFERLLGCIRQISSA